MSLSETPPASLTGGATDYDALLQLIGHAEVAIGVIYRPQTERVSHSFEARLPQQFDAVIHLDQPRAVEPLNRDAGWDQGGPPDTFPTGL